MIDPVLNYMNALYLIFQRLPPAFISLIGVVATFSVVLIVVKIVRHL